MKIKCEQCNTKFEYDDTYGLCPNCSFFNNVDNGSPDLDSLPNIESSTTFDTATSTTTETTGRKNINSSDKPVLKSAIKLVYVIAIINIILIISSIFLTISDNGTPENVLKEETAPLYIYNDQYNSQALTFGSYDEFLAYQEYMGMEELPIVEDFFNGTLNNENTNKEDEEDIFNLGDSFATCYLPIDLIIEGTTVVGYNTTPNIVTIEAIIPEGITEIADYAFADCNDLEILIIGDNLKRIGKYAFANLPNLKYIYLNSSSLTTIDDYAFYGVEPEIIILPSDYNNILYIGDYAMYNMNIADQLTENTVLGIETIKHEFDEKLVENDMQITNKVLVKYVGEATHLDIPEGVTMINSDAFVDTNIDSIVIPEGVRYIGKSAFNSSKLTRIVFPSTLEIIDDYAFSNSSKLEKITFNEGLVQIGISAFSDCTKLSDLTIPKTVTTIDRYSFNKTIWEEENAPNSSDWIINDILMQTFSNTTQSYTIPKGVKYVASNSIDCYEKTPSEIIITDGVLSIQKYALNFPHQVTLNLTIPNSVEYISNDLIPYSELDFDMLYIQCKENSYAYDYAVKNNCDYKFN